MSRSPPTASRVPAALPHPACEGLDTVIGVVVGTPAWQAWWGEGEPAWVGTFRGVRLLHGQQGFSAGPVAGIVDAARRVKHLTVDLKKKGASALGITRGQTPAAVRALLGKTSSRSAGLPTLRALPADTWSRDSVRIRVEYQDKGAVRVTVWLATDKPRVLKARLVKRKPPV